MDHPPAERAWADQYWSSPDGLKLHYRDYPGPDGALPVLCLHGLTRNARDFGSLAEHLAPRHRVIVPELRGRGDSEYARDTDSYTPLTYAADVEALLAELALGRFAVVGTSLGGLLAMMLASADVSRLAGVVLNDIGPTIEEDGLARIRSYVGQGRSFPTWMHAARAMQESSGAAFPEYGIEQWIAMAKRCMAIGQSGRIVFDYDMGIADPFSRPGGEAGVDLWPALETLKQTPVTILRGEFSDVLSEATLQEMLRRLPLAEAATVARVGHAPMLDEDDAVAAIDALLERAA
ncbi:MAG: alpha/beta hydrolase [Sphingomonadales bacterium]|nr:alpha/beta hydrolase [Sphingomonadales bacterium]MBD3774947.1 alpha/beta hydrolase [Paracoccaceae bacterium]